MLLSLAQASIAAVAALEPRADSATAAGEHYRTAHALQQQGKIREAIEALKRAVSLQPDFAEARYALASLWSQHEISERTGAIDQLLELLRSKPDHVGARALLADLLESGGDLEAAVDQLQQAVHKAPKVAELQVQLGQKLYRAKKLEHARLSFDRALELQSSLSGAHYGIGLILRDLGKKEEATESFRQVLKLNPQNAYAHFHLGKLLSQGEIREVAQLHFEEAVKLDPRLAEAHLELGFLYFKSKRLDEAERAFRAAIESNGKLERALYGLAKVLNMKGLNAEAQSFLQRVEQINKETAQTRLATKFNDEGITLMDTGRLNEALQAFQRALKYDPAFAIAAYNQGVLLAHQRKLSEAAQSFRQAIRLRPALAMAHYGLGVVLKTQGAPEADEEIRKAHLLRELVRQSGFDGYPLPNRPKERVAENSR